MLLPGHAAGGYLATRLLLEAAHTSLAPEQFAIIYTVGIVASIIPDLDLIPFFASHTSVRLQTDDTHRKYISHFPLAWLAFGLAIAVGGIASGSHLMTYTGLALIVGSWSHFLFDSIEYGIIWLWPFSLRQYALHAVPAEEIDTSRSTAAYYWTFFWKYYVRRWTFRLEIALIALAIWVAIHS